MMCKTDQTCFITITFFSGEKEIPTTNKFTLRASQRGQDLYDYIEKLLNSPADTFELFLRAPGMIIDLSTKKDSTMSELGVDFSCNQDSNEVNHRNYTLFVTYNTNKRLPSQYGENTYDLAAVSNNASDVGNQLVTELALELVSEPTLKPVSEPTLKPISEPTLKPISEPTLKPVSEPTLKPVSEPTLKPISEPTLKPVSEPPLKPISEPTLKPVLEPTLKPVSEPTLKPVSEPTLEPVSEPTLKRVSEPTLKAVSEATLKPVSEPTLKPLSKPTSEPASKPASEPASQPTDAASQTSESVSEPASQLASESASELASEPASEPASGPTSEPASESVSEPASESVSEPASESVSEPASESVSEPASDMYLNLYQDFYQSPNQNQQHGTTSEPISEPTPESVTKTVSQPATQPVCANFKSFIKPETSYVGLVNQAMTCYLNSLLQSLYMTPEFRNALYNWEYVDGSEKDAANSIPYQLQKLFLNLQTSTKSAVETTSLTKSFGWDSTEAWQQHDIQELCRVMFDTLEQKLKNTEQADLINRLYEGKMIDYVKCLECGTQKSREDTFLDIPLPVRPFGSNVAYNSVEEAIRAFVQYETLEGANQYHCEKCNKKCDAHKGLKFTKFPYLLTLHLKRFDFDYKTFHRIKLNDKVTFPDILNLNSFISSTNQESPGGEEDIGLGIKCDDSSTTDSGTLDDDCPPCENNLSNSSHQTNHDQDDDEGIDMNNGPSTSNCNAHNHENEKNRGNSAGAKGPYLYELFSIMIHSGNASGGHYYAYIKDFRTQEWLWFNDQNVSQITHDDIQKTYGGGATRAYYSGAYSSSTNAYMLMYRQIDPARNALPMQVQDFPKHIEELVNKMREGETNDRRQNLDKEISARVKVYCGHPTKEKSKIYEYTYLRLMPDDVWSDVTKEAYMKFQLEGVVNLDQCRLVTYDAQNDVIKRSYEGREHETVSSIWFIRSRYSLLLEIRRKDEEFECYQPGSHASKVYVIDVPKEEVIKGPIIVRAMLSQTVREYKQIVGKAINMDPKQMKIVLRKHTKDLTLIDSDDNNLRNEGFSHATKVYVSSMLDTETVPFHWSKLFAIIENLGNVILLHVELPDTSKEILEELNIPSLEDKCKEIEKPISNGPSKLVANDSKRNVEAKLKLLLDSYNREISDLSKLVNTNEEQTVRNISPQLGEPEEWSTNEQSNSEDSSLSDSDKTLVGDAPEIEFVRLPYLLANAFDERRIDGYHRTAETGDWDIDDNTEYYFKATPCTNSVEKQLSVLVDNRTKMSVFKKNLEPYVGVSAEYFKIFRNSIDYGDTACSCLMKQLTSFENGERITVKLRRALRSGETKVKVYLLNLKSIELCKFLCEWIFSMDMTVGQVKRELLAEIKKKHDIDIPYERCRLREKYLKIPSKVFLDDQKFEDVRFSSHFEMIIQELPDKEPVTEYNQIVVLVKKWTVPKMQLGPFQEIVMDGRSVEELTKKLSAISDIPEEHLDVARGKGGFPYDMPFLPVESDLDWNEHLLNESPFTIDDGSAFLYKDRREKPKLLTPHEVREITTKEAPLQILSMSGRYYSSRRQEKALKIYLDTK